MKKRLYGMLACVPAGMIFLGVAIILGEAFIGVTDCEITAIISVLLLNFGLLLACVDLVVFIVKVCRTPQFTKKRKIYWGIMLALFSVFIYPVFWYRYIYWEGDEKAENSRRGPALFWAIIPGMLFVMYITVLVGSVKVPDPIFNPEVILNILIVFLFAMPIFTIVSIMLFILHVCETEETEGKRLRWIILFLVCCPLSLPIYWRIYVRKRRGSKRFLRYAGNGFAVCMAAFVILCISYRVFFSYRLNRMQSMTEKLLQEEQWTETHDNPEVNVEEDAQESSESVLAENNQDVKKETETDTNNIDELSKEDIEEALYERELVRERPVLAGECLWSIAADVYGDPYEWSSIYELNKELIGENPNYIQKGQYLVLPERIGYTDSKTCFAECNYNITDWEGITEYIDPDCGYDIETCIFYYTLEGEGEQFKICYPKLIAHNGKDVSAINEGIRERAMKYADEMLINRTEDFEQHLRTEEGYNINYVRSDVNYIISYLDENVISVVFRDHLFLGNIYLEDYEMRTYVADINTGIRYKNEDLWTNLEDRKLAEKIYDDMASQHEESVYEMQIFDIVLNAELIQEAVKTNGTIDKRHFMNTFLTEDGVGFSLSYRVGEEIDGNYSIMRGWTKTILPREQTIDYQTDALIWEY